MRYMYVRKEGAGGGGGLSLGLTHVLVKIVLFRHETTSVPELYVHGSY